MRKFIHLSVYVLFAAFLGFGFAAVTQIHPRSSPKAEFRNVDTVINIYTDTAKISCYDIVLYDTSLAKRVAEKPCGQPFVVHDSAATIRVLMKGWRGAYREIDSLKNVIWELEYKLNKRPTFL